MIKPHLPPARFSHPKRHGGCRPPLRSVVAAKGDQKGGPNALQYSAALDPPAGNGRFCCWQKGSVDVFFSNLEALYLCHHEWLRNLEKTKHDMLGEYEIQFNLLLFPIGVLHNQRHEMEQQIQ